MNLSLSQMLSTLPHELQERGWVFLPDASLAQDSWEDTLCIAVYERPYAIGLDNRHFANLTGDGHIRVSTGISQSASWEDAHHDAIQEMVFIDGKRKSIDGDARR